MRHLGTKSSEISSTGINSQTSACNDGARQMLPEVTMAADPVICDFSRGIIWRLPNRVSASNNATFLVEQRTLLCDPDCVVRFTTKDDSAGMSPRNTASVILCQLGRLALMQRRATLANSPLHSRGTSSSEVYPKRQVHIPVGSSSEQAKNPQPSTEPSSPCPAYLRSGRGFLPQMLRLMQLLLKQMRASLKQSHIRRMLQF